MATDSKVVIVPDTGGTQSFNECSWDYKTDNVPICGYIVVKNNIVQILNHLVAMILLVFFTINMHPRIHWSYTIEKKIYLAGKFECFYGLMSQITV